MGGQAGAARDFDKVMKASKWFIFQAEQEFSLCRSAEGILKSPPHADWEQCRAWWKIRYIFCLCTLSRPFCYQTKPRLLCNAAASWGSGAWSWTSFSEHHWAPSSCSRVMNLQKHGKEGSWLKRGRGDHRIFASLLHLSKYWSLQEQNNPHSPGSFS